VRYSRLTPALLRRLNIRAVLLSGHHTTLKQYDPQDLAGLEAVLEEAAWPTLGLCGGFQFMAQFFGAEVGPMEHLAAGAAEPETPIPPELVASRAPEPDIRRERGFLPVTVVEAHPLFDGLGQSPVFFHLHSWEVKSLPEDFVRLAGTDICQIQVMAHQDVPLFGVQFHPELYTDSHPDGRKLLKNLFKIAGIP
jgi:GMP synthase (glutamine-hydrolysing)